MKRFCQKGFALLEFALSALTSLSLVMFFLSLCYTSLARLWLNQATYETVICLSQGQNQKTCEAQLKAKGQWIGAKADTVNLEVQSRRWQAKVHWKLFKGIEFSTQRRVLQEAFYQ